MVFITIKTVVIIKGGKPTSAYLQLQRTSTYTLLSVSLNSNGTLVLEFLFAK
jgi:hypothetical protein